MFKPNTIVPLYEQLMEKIKSAINTGNYKPGDKLPSEIDMARQNNVSVITARKAVNELAAVGYVEKKQGKGTFVATPKYGRDYTHIMGFSEACNLMGLKAGSKLLDHKIVVPNSAVLTALGLPPGSQTVFISRLRFVNDEPMAIEDNYFSLDFAFLLNEALEDSLFDVLREKADINIEKSNKLIEICRATSKEAQLLNLRKNNPLLLVRSTAFAHNGKPVYVCTQIINGERFKLHV